MVAIVWHIQARPHLESNIWLWFHPVNEVLSMDKSWVWVQKPMAIYLSLTPGNPDQRERLGKVYLHVVTTLNHRF